MFLEQNKERDKMKMTAQELIEKVADQLTEGADLDALMAYFRDGQIAFLENMTESELKEYSSEILGYNVDEEL